MALRPSRLDLKSSYSQWVSKVRTDHGELGLRLAIGGEFEAFGIVEREMLKHYGLKENDYVVDVGCGAGRLSLPLKYFLTGKYLGTDIVDELIDYARTITDREDWRFELADSFIIPEQDNAVDFVCFFSVFTHLLHEQSYLYIEEAKRVLKQNGRILFSFLEFGMDIHWDVFAATVADQRNSGIHPLNVFIERTAIQAWATHLDLRILEIQDGSNAFVKLPHPITLEDGRVMKEYGNLGQSICVMTR